MNEFSHIGDELVDYAEHTAEFTAKRGLLDELFPFIYVASRRMSLRAICRWLEETKRIKISVNAVSKAMRNQEAFWRDLADEICPAARTFAEGYDKHPLSVLDNEDFFASLEGSTPSVAGETPEEIENELDRVKDAEITLRDRWYNLPQEARTQCWRYIAGEFAETADDKSEGEKNECEKRTE
jgi:CRISPR/Cas system-associated endonuclease Cas1